jgi:hypothetical protein
MMAVLQRLNAGSFFLYSLLSVFVFLALVLQCSSPFFAPIGHREIDRNDVNAQKLRTAKSIQILSRTSWVC